jgi:hypothetical protein
LIEEFQILENNSRIQKGQIEYLCVTIKHSREKYKSKRNKLRNIIEIKSTESNYLSSQMLLYAQPILNLSFGYRKKFYSSLATTISNLWTKLENLCQAISRLNKKILLIHADQKISSIKRDQNIAALFSQMYSLTNLSRRHASPEDLVQITCEKLPKLDILESHYEEVKTIVRQISMSLQS